MADVSVSVVVPVLDEAESLRTTVEHVLADNGVDVCEVVVVTAARTPPRVRDTLTELQGAHPGRIVVVEQTLPRLGGALRRGIEAATGTHIVTMYSDLESDPASVRVLIAACRRAPAAVINASRWRNGSSFQRYGAGKLVLNWLFQRAFAGLFRADITDFTFGYRLYPAGLLQSIAFTQVGHSFVFESLLQVITRGVVVIEVPTRWIKRREGRSQITLFTYLSYWSLGLRTWFEWVRPRHGRRSPVSDGS